MFREVCQDSYLLSWLIKNKGGKKYFVSPRFTDSLGFIFPSWLTHRSWDWTKSPAVFAVKRSAMRYCWRCVGKQNVCLPSVPFRLFGSSRKTQQLVERIWPGCVLGRAGDLSKANNQWMDLLADRESSHTLPLRCELNHISLLLLCETVERVGLQYLTSVWFSVA